MKHMVFQILIVPKSNHLLQTPEIINQKEKESKPKYVESEKDRYCFY